MTAARDHHHAPDAARPRAVLALAAGLTAAAFAAETAGGLASGSLGLLADAAHVFMDFGGLLFSLVALVLADRPVSERRTFGFHRLEVLAAFVNGAAVAGLALWIGAASLARLRHPAPVRLEIVLAVGAAGLTANLLVAALLHRHRKSDLNLRGAFLHVLSDALASVAVLAGAGLQRATGRTFIDPLIGLSIAGLILWNAARLLRESVNLLLEGVPAGLDLGRVTQGLRSVPGVVAVHDVHVWGLCSHLVSLSAHIALRPERLTDSRRVLEELNALLKDRFGIRHTTFQLESADPVPTAE